MSEAARVAGGVAVWAGTCVVPAVALVTLLGWRRAVSAKAIAGTLVLGLALGLLAALTRRAVLRAIGLDDVSAEALLSLLVHVAFLAPLEHALTLAAAWPAFRRGMFKRPRDGVVVVAAAGAGVLIGARVGLIGLGWHGVGGAARALAATPTDMMLCCIWGFVLGASPAGRPRRGFFVAWLAAAIGAGVMHHVLARRGDVAWVGALPLFISLAALTFAARSELLDVAPRRSRRASLPPMSLVEVQEALSRRGRPTAIPFIALGALVTQGVILVMLVAAVVAGRRWGVDFAALDDPDGAAAAPLTLLGGAVTLAFPVAGFLLTRARDTTTLVEPAISASLAIVALMVLLGVAAPVALAFGLAGAPIALALACAGAWVGMGRLVWYPPRPMRAFSLFAVAAAFSLASCGGPPKPTETAPPPPEGSKLGGKVHKCGEKDTVHKHDLDAHAEGVTQAFIPCSATGGKDFSGVIKVESTPEGIHIVIEATDDDVTHGALGSDTKGRDAVIIYPKGKGSKAVEIPLTKTEHGYRGEKTIPYEELDKLHDEGTKIEVAVFDHDAKSNEPAEAMHVQVAVSTGKSCEKAIDENPQTMDMGKKGGAKVPDLTDSQLGAPMKTSAFFSHCGLRDNENADICVALKNGKPLGVSVTVAPSNKKTAACIDRAARKVHFPSSDKLDVVHQKF